MDLLLLEWDGLGESGYSVDVLLVLADSACVSRVGRDRERTEMGTNQVREAALVDLRARRGALRLAMQIVRENTQREAIEAQLSAELMQVERNLDTLNAKGAAHGS